MPTCRGRSKDRDLRRHVRERFYVRFNLTLTHALEMSIIKQIEDGQIDTFIEKQSNRISRHRVVANGQTIDVIYDKARQQLVTAMYPDDAEQWTEKLNTA